MTESAIDDVVSDVAAPCVLTGADLQRLGRGLPPTFDVALVTDAGPATLHCEMVLRVLPGRRIVVRARLDEVVVLAKLFVGSRASAEQQWEERGYAAFINAGVATPPLIARGTLIDGGEALLFEFLDAAVPVPEAELLKTIPILARLHTHGVVQNDLHLGNLLHDARGLFLVDGGSVSGMGTDKPLSMHASIRNLALFLAQFGIRAEPKFVAAWHTYAVARSFKRIDADARALIEAVHRARRARVRAYMRKVLRDCSEFYVEQRFDRFLVCNRASFEGNIASLIENIDVHFERGLVIKAGDTTTVVRLYIDGAAFVIKRYNVKSWRHRLMRLWRPTPARRAWRNAHRLRLLGIPTCAPVALIEHRFGPLRGSAYLVMRDVGGIDLRERFGHEHMQPLVALFADLRHAGLVHGDTNATNFIDVTGTIHLIDLDAMRAPWTKRGVRRGAAADLERFGANWPESATIRAALTRAFGSLTAQTAASSTRHRR
jgi:tRNA A-37 threonylcarbamoyl transferase component Bud32